MSRHYEKMPFQGTAPTSLQGASRRSASLGSACRVAGSIFCRLCVRPLCCWLRLDAPVPASRSRLPSISRLRPRVCTRNASAIGYTSPGPPRRTPPTVGRCAVPSPPLCAVIPRHPPILPRIAIGSALSRSPQALQRLTTHSLQRCSSARLRCCCTGSSSSTAPVAPPLLPLRPGPPPGRLHHRSAPSRSGLNARVRSSPGPLPPAPSLWCCVVPSLRCPHNPGPRPQRRTEAELRCQLQPHIPHPPHAGQSHRSSCCAQRQLPGP